VTSLKKRLDHLLNELSLMGLEIDEKSSSNVATQLAIINGAFKESSNYPVCCFRYDLNSRVICDVNGPLVMSQFMEKCRDCQAQIKEALQKLKTD
jgi:hypothetical protein